MRAIILLSTIMPPAVAIYLLGHALGGLLLGLRVESFNLFFGKPLHTFHLKAFPIHIGWIPTGGSVGFEESFNDASLLKKVAVYLAGPLTLLITSVACIRYDRAVAAFLSGFPQLFQGALSPLSSGRASVAGYFHQHGDSVSEAYGVLAAKLAAFNLLPIPTLSGGQIILSSIPGGLSSRWLVRTFIVGFIVVFAMSMSWLAAVGAYFLGL